MLCLDENKLTHFSFAQLAKLVYRDNVEQKHDDKSGLLKEIKDKGKGVAALEDCPSKVKAKTIADKRVATTPMAEVMLKQLIAASRWQLLEF